MNRLSPAFQFYPSDFVGGAPAFMKPLETHVYVWLLCLEWNHGGFTFNEEDLALWCRVSVEEFAKSWRKVSESFVERDGRFFNPRLDAEREKQREYSERMSENGKKGGRPKADEKPRVSRGLAAAKPNESISISTSISTSSTTPKAPALSAPDDVHDVQAVCDHYIARHPRRRIGPKDRKAVAKALTLGYSRNDLCEAIDGNAADDWHRDKGKHELPYVLRDTGKIDDFRAKLEASRPKIAVDPVTRLPTAAGLKVMGSTH